MELPVLSLHLFEKKLLAGRSQECRIDGVELADKPLTLFGAPLSSHRNRLFLALAAEEEDPDNEACAGERDQDRADDAGDLEATDVLYEERQRRAQKINGIHDGMKNHVPAERERIPDNEDGDHKQKNHQARIDPALDDIVVDQCPVSAAGILKVRH